MLESPFADRLYTNYVPLDPEIEELRRLIAGPLAEISRFDEKIAHLQSMIDDLRRERQVFATFVDAHRALLSGTRRLPQELLQEIFTYCLPSNRTERSSTTSEAPMLLGRICSSWRRIVMSTPQLWSSIHVDVSEPPSLVLRTSKSWASVVQRVRMVQRSMELSGTCSLSISFVYSGDKITQTVVSAATLLFQFLYESSQRWETLDLRLPPSLFVQFFATLSKMDVPLLKSLCLKLENPYTDAHSGAMSILATAPIFRVPSLRSLSISDLDISLLVAGWNHLNHLDFNRLDGSDRFSTAPITVPGAIQILSLCPNLISCRMHKVNALGAQTHFPAISLPFLRSLDITEVSRERTSDLTAFFDALKVPGLREFKFTRHALGGAVVPFKSIISPEIECIELSLVTLATVVECLPLLPRLKRISVRNPLYHPKKPLGDKRLRDDLLTLLTPSSDVGECLCPHLEEIKFEFGNHSAVTDHAIRVFLTARTSHPAIARLKKATFSFSDSATPISWSH